MELLSRLQNGLNKPYYFFRPGQVLRRLRRLLTGYRPAANREQVRLPWGFPILVRSSDVLGSAVLRLGIYDVCVSEVLWRLVENGEMTVDAGANIGHMTSIMSKRVGGTGGVFSFEPHPEVFRELAANVVLWESIPDVGTIHLHEMALSKEPGVASLRTTSDFAVNRGTATMEGSSGHVTEDNTLYTVSVGCLDDVIGSRANIGVMKIDVEGHEISLLQGATSLLSERRVRDIVFEDHNFYPSPVTNHLEQLGYTIFSLHQGPLSVRVSPAKRNEEHYKYEAQSYLATLDPSRALALLRKPGYQSLQTNGDGNERKTLTRIAAAIALLIALCILAAKKKVP